MIENYLAAMCAEGVKALFDVEVSPADIQVQPTRKDFEGELTIVTFPLVRYAKKSPEETGSALGEYLQSRMAEVESFGVVKGFLNLTFTSQFWVENLLSASRKEDYGFAEKGSKGMVIVEYSSPNTNKPLHLGHLRNNFLGYSVAEILKAAGHEVKKVQIINDRGIHICKSMVAWEKFGEGETPETAGLKGDHLVGKYYVRFDQELKKQVAGGMDKGMSKEEAEAAAPIMQEARETLLKWEKKDPEVYALWEKMNGWVYKGFEKTYNRMGVDFDKLYYESQTWIKGKDEALKGVKDGVFTQREDGSVWADLTPDGLDEKILLRKDGTTVYMTQDIGTAILRYQDFPDVTQMVYTVGNEQEYHFKVLFLILQKIGYEWAKNCYHLSYGMVELPEGKMKSREGTVIDADDIMQAMADSAEEITTELGKLEGLEQSEKEGLYEMIGMSALKYFLLKVDPKKNMLFDPKESIDFNGHTGPFIQYAHARIQSVLRNIKGELKFDSANIHVDEFERRVHFKIHSFPKLIEEAAADYSPAVLANYAFDLVKDFNSFYQNSSILHAETEDLKNYRALLAKQVGEIIKKSMALLGIQSPDRM
ncbi:arginine--tRNA ligase [Cryomorphaceae bacterium 1068]|nr:arginine--tRNA ligase [Cryomorphaceae bacterium 1068]